MSENTKGTANNPIDVDEFDEIAVFNDCAMASVMIVPSAVLSEEGIPLGPIDEAPHPEQEGEGEPEEQGTGPTFNPEATTPPNVERGTSTPVGHRMKQTKKVWPDAKLDRLFKLVRIYGKNWDKITKYFSDSTPATCRMAHYNAVNRGQREEEETEERSSSFQNDGNPVTNGNGPERNEASPMKADDNGIGIKGHKERKEEEEADIPKYRDWTLKEMQDFHVAYVADQNEWKIIAGAVGRTVKDIEDYYYNYYLDSLFGNMSKTLNVTANATANVSTNEKSQVKQRWTEDERKILIQGIKKLRPRLSNDALFEEIAESIPGRTGMACKEQYRAILKKEMELAARKRRACAGDPNETPSMGYGGGGDPGSSRKRWTEEEQERLGGLYKKLKPKFPSTNEDELFEMIAAKLPNRTAPACKTHYKRIFWQQAEDTASDSGSESDDSGPSPAKKHKAGGGRGSGSRKRWSKEECCRYAKLFKRFGKDWARYEGQIPGRTVKSCTWYYYKTFRGLKNDDADGAEDGAYTPRAGPETQPSEVVAVTKEDIRRGLIALSLPRGDEEKEKAALDAAELCEDKKCERQVDMMINKITRDTPGISLQDATTQFCEEVAAVLKLSGEL